MQVDVTELLLIELAAVVLLSILARRIDVPQPVVLVLGGLLVGVLPFLEPLALPPEAVLLVFLPPILFPSAAEYAREDVRPALGAIGLLAIGLVLVSAGAIALVAQLVLGIGWGPALALGAVLAPTDPVSATSLLRRAGAPARLATILEGESLINDGTALTVLRVAIASVGASIGIGEAALQFLLIAAGGALLGVVIGFIVSEALRRLDDVEIESGIAVLAAYGSYVIAEEVHVSGILCTVLAGYVVGSRRSEIHSPETRLTSGSFWELLQWMSVSVLFVLVGSEISAVVGETNDGDLARLLGAAVVIAGAALAIRTAWMFAVPRVIGLLGREAAAERTREQAVLSLGGMRGAISVAAALSIPMAVDGTPFPDRPEVVFVGLVGVVLLLVPPALTLPLLMRRLGVGGGDPHGSKLSTSRQALLKAAIDRADELAADDDGDLDRDALRRARDLYAAQLAAERDDGDGEGRSPRETARAQRDVMLRLLEAERAELGRLTRSGEVAGELHSQLERDLDLEERRLERRL